MKGLANKGHTCYFNAALQCLAYCPNMSNYFLSGRAAEDANPKLKGASALAAAYADFVRDYWTVEGAAADPSAVYAAFVKACRGFTPSRQHDAHEAMVCLLDKLHDGLSRFKPGDVSAVFAKSMTDTGRKAWRDRLRGAASVVSEVFTGQIEAHVQGDGYSSVTYDHFTCLSLAVSGASLAACMQRHMASEPLSDFKVDGNATAVQLSKRFTYLPRILVIHLKRFDGSDKIDKFIDYPAELDLGAFACPGCEHHYQLFAVCLHRGTADDGHYTTCGEVKGRWYAMDDEAVAHMPNINDIIQRDAYVLLYKRL